MTRRPLLLAATIFPLYALAFPAQETSAPGSLAAIKALKCVKTNRALRVSFRVEGAFGPEFESTIESGIPVTFVHKLTVVRRRALFFDKTLVRMTLEATASLDTLTQQYTLTRSIDAGEIESSTTDRRDLMEAWLAEVRELAIPLPEDAAKGILEIRVKSEYETNYYLLWVLPWSLSALDEKECR